MNFFKIFFSIINVIFLVIIQVSFINGLPNPLNKINLILLFLIFSLGFSKIDKILKITILIAILLDIYSFLPFGLHLLLLPLLIFGMYLLLISFLTNKSLYSFLIMNISANLIFNFYFYFLQYFIYKNDFLWMLWIKQQLIMILVNSILVILLFYIFDFFKIFQRR